MKKFITYISMLPEDSLHKCDYESDAPKLRASGIRFPISAMLSGYAEAGEEVCVITVMERGNEDCLRNQKLLLEELDETAARVGFAYTLRLIEISPEETAKEHLRTFSRLISEIEDGDIVHACLTYGTKPTPIVELMALNFAYKAKKDVSVRCIAYGKLNRKNGTVLNAVIYDITPLFYMNEITDQLSAAKVKHPEQFIKKLLEDGAEE